MAVVTSLAMTVVPNTLHTKIILMVGKCVFCSGPLLVGFTHILHDYVNATGTIAWLPRWQLSNIINMMIFVCSPVSVHDDVIKWKHFPRYRPFVRGIHRSPVNSPHKGQWRGALMFSLICVWINVWVNNREAGDLRRYRAHYDVIVMEVATPFLLGWCHVSVSGANSIDHSIVCSKAYTG